MSLKEILIKCKECGHEWGLRESYENEFLGNISTTCKSCGKVYKDIRPSEIYVREHLKPHNFENQFDVKLFKEKIKMAAEELKKNYRSMGIFAPVVLVAFLSLWLVLILLPLAAFSIAIILILTGVLSLFSFLLGKAKQSEEDEAETNKFEKKNEK